MYSDATSFFRELANWQLRLRCLNGSISMQQMPPIAIEGPKNRKIAAFVQQIYINRRIFAG
jgi:hypothetical protein